MRNPSGVTVRLSDRIHVQLSLFQSQPKPQSPRDLSKTEIIRKVLGPRIPDAALEEVTRIILEKPVRIKVVRARTSKSGDFRPPFNGNAPQITVNGSLNPYAFLITLIHELAHHHVHHDYSESLAKFSLRRKKKPLPHGDEWKQKFQTLMQPLLNRMTFPADLLEVLKDYMDNPKASSSVDHKLSKALKAFDPQDFTVRLEELPHDAVFSLHGRRFFRKKEKVRTRFRCICLKTNRVYLVSPGAPVEVLKPE